MTQDQVDYQSDKLEMAKEFDYLLGTAGWKRLETYYQALIASFSTQVLVNGDKPIISYEAERQQLIGVRKLFMFVQEAIKFLEDERKRDNKN